MGVGWGCGVWLVVVGWGVVGSGGVGGCRLLGWVRGWMWGLVVCGGTGVVGVVGRGGGGGVG